MSNSPNVPQAKQRRNSRNDSLDGLTIPDAHRLDEASPASLLLHALISGGDDEDPLLELLTTIREEMGAFGALACASKEMPEVSAVLFGSFERRLHVMQEIRRREMAGRGAK